MKAGSLNKRITIEKPVSSLDEYGDQTGSFELFAKVWAKIMPKSGRNSFIAGKHTTDTTHEIEIRYSEKVSQIKSNFRIVFGTRVFEIENPPLNPMEANERLILICKELE